MRYSYRFVIIAALFVTCLLTANIIAVKVWALGPVSLSAAVIIFPFSYIFGDILTEVYGYKEARKIIWLGFLCNLLFVVFAWFAQLLPGLRLDRAERLCYHSRLYPAVARCVLPRLSGR